MNSSLSRYRENQVSSNSPEDTILMLYDGAIRFLNSANQELQANNCPEKSLLIEKAIKIVDHLQSCLNLEHGGTIADNLNKLYDYIQIKLTEANLKNDSQKIGEIVDLLQEIRDGWSSVCNQSKDGRTAEIPDDHQQESEKQKSTPETEDATYPERKIAIKI